MVLFLLQLLHMMGISDGTWHSSMASDCTSFHRGRILTADFLVDPTRSRDKTNLDSSPQCLYPREITLCHE
ncbi:hypothetical protein B0H19DRAFT_1106280 [Mycena capillaripes]|nr:hypothetical protein B0H19DRAFT_1106280 [Mycena capillaripes]